MTHKFPLSDDLARLEVSGSRETNDWLYRLIDSDPAARARMIESNMPLVLHLVQEFLRECPAFAYLQDDLISEGFLTLTVEVNRLAESKSRCISDPTSYLSVAIRHAIRDACDAAPLIHPRKDKRYRLLQADESVEVPSVESMSDSSRLTLTRTVESPNMVDLRDELAACCETDLDRQLIRMREEGFSTRKIALELGMSRSVVSKLLGRIRERFDRRNCNKD